MSAIQIASRLEISLEVVAACREVSNARIQQFVERVKNSPAASSIIAHNKARLTKMAEVTDEEKLRTKLRTLSGRYTEIAVKEFQGTRYIVGTTSEILIEEVPYDLGPYTVWLNIEALKRGSAHDHHFLPSRDPQTSSRFMHHTAGGESHPLLRSAHTCWGTFGPMINQAIDDGDVAHLLQLLRTYLSRYNAASPFVRIENIMHARRIER
jgi:hypothetical protein